MSLYNKILVPVDGDVPASHALDHAIAIARDQGARLKLITVLDKGVADYRGAEVGWLDRDKWHEELRVQARTTLEGAGERVRDAAADVSVETEVVDAPKGGVWKRILQAAEDWGADLLVVGTHGRHGVDRVLLGSVSEALVRHGHLPLLVVPAPAHEETHGGGS